MEVFTLNKTAYNNGILINGIQSILWVERYNQEGEFEIVGPPTKSFRTSLAVGTLISHTESTTIMMVEEHTIDEDDEGTPVVKITGRTIDEIMMENRVVTHSAHESDAFVNDISVYPMEYILTSAGAADHAFVMLQRFLEVATYVPEERIPNLQIVNDVDVVDPLPGPRLISTLSLLSTAIRDILSSIDCGIKLERPNISHPNHLQLILHNGTDKSNTVRFDYNAGDISAARYNWSLKGLKNSAYISSANYTVRFFRDGEEGLDLRLIPLTSDWEQDYGLPLFPADEAAIKAVLAAQTYTELSKRKFSHIMDATISKNNRYIYGVDYNIGDIVYVIGNYGVEQKMRVVEFARTVDKHEDSSFPTLAPIT